MFEELFLRNPYFKKITENFGNNRINITGLTEGAKSHFVYGFSKQCAKRLLIITKSDAASIKAAESLSFYNINAHVLRAADLNLYNIDAGSRETFLSRIDCLKSAAFDKGGVYIASVDALTGTVLPEEKLVSSLITLRTGDTIKPAELAKKLLSTGYKRSDMTESPGQFSMRGDIADIFSVGSDLPMRLEFFGDEIESIRFYDPRTQISTEKTDKAEIICALEIILDEGELSSLISALRKKISGKKISDGLKESLKADIARFENEGVFIGADRYIPMIYPVLPTFVDYFDVNDTVIIFDEPQRIAEKAEATGAEHAEIITSALEKELILKENRDIFISFDDILSKCLAFPSVSFTEILTGRELFRPDRIFNVTSSDTVGYYGKLNLFLSDIINFKNKGYTVIIPVPASKIDNFRTYMTSSGIDAVILNENSKLPSKGVYLINKVGFKGFCYPELKFILVYDSSIFGEYKKPQKKSRQGSGLMFSDLQIGDYVVHDIHGIGKYIGTEQLAVEGVKREYVKIKYQGTDYLYLPVNQLGSLNKYVGAGERQIRLNKLGGQEFKKVKARVRAACAELADKLIELYAEREKIPGHAYMPDTDMQAEFEQTFPYTETDDQLKCIRDVKKDMESSRPMDRLICGDVGYGKTEIALRAAFKCAVEGKQTAYLASTTVLAQQHYNTFKSRMENFPVTVEMLSRFRTKKEQTKVIENLKSGKTDIVIGTHRLLSKDIAFKDLGLLIVDEEQRFGVEHKEKLKELKKNIDVLTLTATPIPRTLHMSMIGIRDMSLLSEPPLDRFPVQTYVLEYKESVVYDAIERELSRKGQVFYLFNRVEMIDKVAERLQNAFPEATVAAVHGQMSETAIEKTFLAMLNGEIDILVCTTIIETGIDVSNANTIIVENSDTLGLSQLYQLRGRVGRSNRLAYCYLTYVKGKVLTEQSESRLKAIKEFTEFGSGFRIAMRDLEIRGAGNILGSSQHGHMDAVGYDMYVRILDSAVKEKKGEKEAEDLVCRVDIKEDAYIPETYIPAHDMRMLMYKKISSVKNEEDSLSVIEEFKDRFSEPPRQTRALIDIALIKAIAETLNITEITDNAGSIFFYFLSPENLDFMKISLINREFRGRILVCSGSKPGFSYRASSEERKNKTDNIKKILQMLK